MRTSPRSPAGGPPPPVALHHVQPSISSCSVSQYGTTSEASDPTRRRGGSEQPQRTQLPASRSCAALTAAAEAPCGAPTATAAAPAAAVVQHPQALAAKSSSQLALLLSAIDACEGEEGPSAAAAAAAPSPLTPETVSQLWAPFTPLTTPQEAPAGGPGPLRRAFRHSAGSAFRPLACSAPLPPLPSDAALEAKRLELERRLAMLREVRAQVCALAPPLSNVAGAPSCSQQPDVGSVEELARLQLAEKLLVVRAALQARIARKRAMLTAAADSCFGALPGAGAPAGDAGLLCGLAPDDFASLASAKALLAQCQL